jgi:phage repressor protein C with HTH and peptisase S24 domain
MSSLSHAELWTAIDALAKRFDLTPSAMARLAGLDPTSFNRSKRGDADSRPRWPSTESLAKVLEATGVGFSEFAAMTEAPHPPRARGVPLMSVDQARTAQAFDAAGFPIGPAWDEADFPGLFDDGVYALEVSGDELAPVYRDGDRLLVSPVLEPRRGDRVVVKTLRGALLIMTLSRLTARSLQLTAVNGPGERVLERSEAAWIARILWASQ